MQEIAQRQPIEAYIDFHGHSCQHGTFAFACPNDGDRRLAHAEKLFPKLLSIISENFSWQRCEFSIPDDERKTAGRIVVRQEFGVVQAFTLETSFGGAGGLLYDERGWREIGAKVGEGLYHLVANGASTLRATVQSDLMREIEHKAEVAALYSQNTARAGGKARHQPSRKPIVPRVKKLKVAT
jgi:hypothetical protein